MCRSAVHDDDDDDGCQYLYGEIVRLVVLYGGGDDDDCWLAALLFSVNALHRLACQMWSWMRQQVRAMSMM